MKNFKKVLVLLFVAIFTIVLVGCGNNEEKKLLDEYADKIYLGKLDAVNNDIKLPKYAYGNKEYAVTWTSDNEAVIKVQEYEDEKDKESFYQGFVELAKEETVVTLTATVTHGKNSVTRTFAVTVVADAYTGYETIAEAKLMEGKTKDESKVKFNGVVTYTTPKGFVTSDASGSFYTYASNHGRTVGEKVTVRGTWTYYNNMVQIKNPSVKVLGTEANFDLAKYAEVKSISEIAAISTKAVDDVNSTRVFKTQFVVNKNKDGEYNTYNLADPKTGDIVDVSKYSSDDAMKELKDFEASKTAEGKKQAYEGFVILYCSRDAVSGHGLWDVLYVEKSAAKVEIIVTDAEKVGIVVNNLKAQFEGMNVIKDITLPVEDKDNNATITWASSNEAILSAAGKYTAPAETTNIKLTATIKVGEVTETLEINVIASTAKPISEVQAAELGKHTIAGTVVAIYKQGFILADETGSILVYKGSKWEADVELGDKLIASGTTSVYNKGLQLGGSTYVKLEKEEFNKGESEYLDATKADAYKDMEIVLSKYVTLEGKITISTNSDKTKTFVNLVIDGATIQGSIQAPTDLEAIKAFENKNVIVRGYTTAVAGNGKFLNIVVTDIKESKTVTDIIAAEEGVYATKATVVAVDFKSFVISDGTSNMLVYIGSKICDKYAIGDVVVLVGKTSEFSGAKQFGNKPAPAEVTKAGKADVAAATPKVLDGAAAEKYKTIEKVTVELVQITGKLTVSSGKYVNIEIAGATIKGSVTNPVDMEAMNALQDQNVVVTGFVVGVASKGKFLNICSTSVVKAN